MKVIGLYDGFGPSYHRIYHPLHNLRGVEKVLITNHLTEERLQAGCDLLYFNRLPPANELQQVLDWRKQYGFKMVVDMDDHYNLDYSHIMRDYYTQYNISSRIIDAIREADAVTVTHDLLAEAVKPYNQNIWVIPNAIPNWEQFEQTQRTGSDKVRLFWQGSITHENDIKLLRGPVKRLAGSYLRDKVLMVMGGYRENEPTWQRMASYYTDGLRIPGSIQPSQDVANYYRLYQYADIALIPLVPSRFNAHKSNLKILEAAHMGIPVVVSAVDPYLGFPPNIVNYVHRQQDWFDHLQKLVNNPTFAEAQGQALKKYCQQVFNHDRFNAVRLELFEELCGKKTEIS